MTRVYTALLGCGCYLPEKVLTNDDMAEIVETSDAWIVERSGIRQRHIADPSELTSSLAAKAANNALENAGIKAAQIDMIIVATTTPDRTFPATAARVQSLIGANASGSFDIQAVCSGFIYGLNVVDSLIQSGRIKTALVIGAETLSRIIDWSDRSTCILFGDGAGAVVVQASKSADSAILGGRMRSDGRALENLYADGGPSLNGQAGYIRMDGTKVFRKAVDTMASISLDVLADTGKTVDDVDWLVPHQANIRILHGLAKKLKIDHKKLINTVGAHANTSAASIPLALATSLEKFNKGDLILAQAVGGGLSWGACLFRW